MRQSQDKISNIVSLLQSRGSGMPYFSDKRYIAHDFSGNNFNAIHNTEEKLIAFVDGGNAPIISAPDFELSLVRVYCSTYLGIRKEECMREDYYVAVSATADDKLKYNAEIVPANGSSSSRLSFDAQDESMKIGKFSAEINVVAGIVRRFLEWQMAASACKTAKMVVTDGSLQTGYPGENIFLENAYSSAIKNDCIFSGISKTSSLLTTTGISLMSAINKIGPSGTWYYHPIAEISHPDHKADICAVKLHNHAKTCYRLEIFNRQQDRLKEAAALLAQNSKDWRYPGYPYGLIDADALARISEKEQSVQAAIFSDLAKQLSTSASDAHEIINNLIR